MNTAFVQIFKAPAACPLSAPLQGDSENWIREERKRREIGRSGNEKRVSRMASPFDFIGSGGWIRTIDLRVMSPTSYLTAPPRGN